MKISTKIITPTVVSLGIFLFAVEFAFVPYFKEKQLEVIIEGERSELQVLAPIIAEELATGDLSKIYSILKNQERIHSESSESGIVLFASSGHQIYPFQENILFHENDDQYLILEEPLIWNDEQLGSFRYELEIEHELDPIHEQLNVLRLGTACVTFFIVIFGGWWNRKLVIKPLDELRLAAKNIQNGELRDALVIRSQDEIGDVYRAFNKMRENILQKNIALHSAVEKAELAALAKSQFLANMSHEIRTPMNAIIGLTHLSLQGQVTKEQHNYLTKIQQSSKGLLGIINDILDFSKIEAGQLDVEKTSFSLDEILQQAYVVNQINAREKGIEFSISRDLSIPDYYLGDPLRIGQILTNIIGNAVKFTEKGGVNINVSCVKKVENTNLLRFTVKDTGIGMSEEQQAKLFTPFSQADASTTRKFGGTGLGLTISLQLLKLMGGEINLQSQKGVGSTFTFDIPLKVTISTETPYHTNNRAALKGIGALVLGNAQNLPSVLASFGVQILAYEYQHTAINWPELNNNIETSGLDLILIIDTDGSLQLDTVFTQLEGATQTKQVPIVLVTAREKELQEYISPELYPVHFISELRTPSAIFDTLITILSEENQLEGSLPANIEQKPAPKIQGANILVVEDNLINTEVARGMLQKFGAEVTSCENGLEALSILTEKQFDLILMDIQMPVMDGYTATRKIRSNPKFTDLPIIALTANAMPSDTVKSLNAGMDDHLAKPIDPQKLKFTLEKWLTKLTIDPPEDNTSITETKSIIKAIPTTYPGLDVSTAVQRLSGDNEKYLSLLKYFLLNNADAAVAMSALLNHQDHSGLAAQAHAMRGSAATLGAIELQSVLTYIEKHCSDAPNKLAPYFEKLEQALHQLSNSVIEFEASIDKQRIQKTEKINTPLTTGTETNIEKEEKLTGLLKKLADLTKTGDVASLEFSEELAQSLSETSHIDTGKKICNSLDNFEFEEAYRLISLLQEERS